MKKYLILFLLLLTPLSQANTKEHRVALVIGINEYNEFNPLFNAVNDANDISKKLKELGFEVITGTNLTRKEILKAASKFRKKLNKYKPENTVALFFYSGHGVQVNGTRYLVPKDYSEPQNITLTKVLDRLKALNSFESFMTKNAETNIIIYDACRNNPFQEYSFAAERALTRDLSAKKNKISTFSKSTQNKLKNIYYLLSTSANQRASDGNGRNGLFTKYLLQNIDKKGYNIDDVMTEITKGVFKESHGKQKAWKEGSKTKDFFFIQGDSNRRDIIIEKRPKWIMPLLIGGTFLLLMTVGYTLKQRRKIAWANEVILKDELKRDKTILDDEIEKSHLIRDQIVGYLKDIKTDKIITLVQSGDKITLGREKPADFVVDDKVISGEHCEISYNPSNKTFQVKDLNSSNGIWLSEGQQLKAGKKHTLKDGQVFYLANEDHPLVLVKSK